MRTWLRSCIVAWFALLGVLGFVPAHAFSNPAVDWVSAAELPIEARQTLALIKVGGPFPYTRDGITFGNYEKRLPMQPRGYYTEYTVKTPGRKDRGPRRIIAGERQDYYYTDDHYQTFRRIRE